MLMLLLIHGQKVLFCLIVKKALYTQYEFCSFNGEEQDVYLLVVYILSFIIH